MLQKKALIGMSGGVDSSVAAFLTIQEGFSCLGLGDRAVGLPGAVRYQTLL